jgi:cytochrome bd ubiquinol oxidase subunit II
MELLPTVWFIAIALLWTGFLLLEGFDLGVGMHMIVTGRSTAQRRVMLNTIGPVWDGNEVWLVTAGAAMFAAFPMWYASLISTFYIPVTIVLVGLIVRAIGIEYRGKGATKRWERSWEIGIGAGSFVVAFGIGAMLAATTTGLPIDANGDGTGGPFGWLTIPAVIGGFASVGFCLVHGATFLGLKSDGSVRIAARRFTTRLAPFLLVPMAGWVILVQVRSGNLVTFAITLLAVVAAVVGWLAARAGHERRAFAGFAGFLVLGVAAIFGAVYPLVLPSTLHTAYDLTISNASSAPYTLGVMSVVAAFGLPLVVVYQGWSYWVFRRRISEAQIPDAHIVLPAIRKPAEKR